MSWIKHRAKQFAAYHSTDFSGVKPEYRVRGDRIYFNSVAGAIEFIPKTQIQLCSFRDLYLNKFVKLIEGKAGSGEYFELYRQIKSTGYKIRFTINLRTRFKYLWK